MVKVQAGAAFHRATTSDRSAEAELAASGSGGPAKPSAGCSQAQQATRIAEAAGHGETAEELRSTIQELRRRNAQLSVALLALNARREEELHESRQRLHLLAEHIEDMFALHERDRHRISYASSGFEKMFGRPLATLYAGDHPWPRWTHEEDVERVKTAYANYRKGDPFDEEYRIVRPDGEIRWIRARAFPVVEADGQVHRDALVVQDVTNERELEEELRQAQKMEAVGALAAGVAHDFNNVLQVILGCIHMCLAPAVPPALARHYLERGAKAAKSGGDLARQLMAFAYKKKANPRPIVVDQELEQLGDLLERLVTENVSVEIRAGAPGRTILADPIQIEQILMNLAANARDAMPSGGTLSIRTEPTATGNHVRIIVQDTGVGMDEKVAARIFDTFFTTKAIGKGTGLGLSTVRNVVKQLRGSIDVKSEVGWGTTFTLRFPCCEPGESVQPRQPVNKVAFSGNVLLVEDNALVRRTVGDYLEELGFHVFEARSAAEAQQICSMLHRPVDLLVADIVLPGMSGPMLAQFLREQHPNLPVLFMSAGAQLVESPALGAEPVLRKPFEKAQLTESLVNVLGKEVGLGDEVAETNPEAGPVTRKTILLVENEMISRTALGALLEDCGYRVLETAVPSQALELASTKDTIDLVVTDVRLPEMDGEQLARALGCLRPDLPVVFMTESRLSRKGVASVPKPIKLDSLIETIRQVLTPPPA